MTKLQFTAYGFCMISQLVRPCTSAGLLQWGAPQHLWQILNDFRPVDYLFAKAIWMCADFLKGYANQELGSIRSSQSTSAIWSCTERLLPCSVCAVSWAESQFHTSSPHIHHSLLVHHREREAAWQQNYGFPIQLNWNRGVLWYRERHITWGPLAPQPD